MFTLACMHVGVGETSTAASPVKRTVSGTSAEGLMSPPSLPEISVSSMDLAFYVHQLRSHLPKASALIGGRPPDGGMAERARAEMEREASSRSLNSSESYAAEFMDRSITSRWDKQKPKVYIYVYVLKIGQCNSGGMVYTCRRYDTRLAHIVSGYSIEGLWFAESIATTNQLK